jgi:hypothetical protein
VLHILHGDFSLKFKLRYKEDNFEWCFIAIYGAAQDHDKEKFLSELVRMGDIVDTPILVGGDFNIIRCRSEKNNNTYTDRCPSLFNAVINSLNLRELQLSGRHFTWANNLQTLTFEKLDMILDSTEWEVKFPQVLVKALPRGISDHTPLLLDTGIISQSKANGFKFELAWLFKDGFHEKVKKCGNRKYMALVH